MRYIEVLIMQFLSNMHRYFYSNALFIARDIIKANEPFNQKLLEKINEIWENTTPELNISLSTVEAYYITNWIRLSRSIEMRDNNDRIVEMPIYKLKKHLDEAYMELRDVVRIVARKYSIDIPFREVGGQGGGVITTGT